MQKPFKEVFSKYEFDEYISKLVEDISVSKITISRDEKKLNLYIISHVIISKEDLIKLQTVMSQKCKILVEIYEKYDLNREYSALQIFESYKNNLSYNMKEKGPIMYRLFCDSKFEFISGSECIIEIPKSLAYEKRLEDYKAYIEQIFIKRFSTPIYISFRWSKNISRDDSSDVSMKLLTPIRSENIESVKTIDLKEENVESKDEENVEIKKKNKNIQLKLLVDEIKQESIKISEIENAPGIYTFNAQVLSVDYTKLRNGAYSTTCILTDFTDSIKAKSYLQENQLEDYLDIVRVGSFFKVKGNCDFNSYENHEFMIVNNLSLTEIEDFTSSRKDNAKIKRVELCVHTKMSKMESLSNIKDLVDTAYSWGHEAIAITDFGVVHGFPDAMHAAEKKDIKIIYGLSAYIVDDRVSIVENPKFQHLNDTIVVFDIETTGFNASTEKIIEIGATKIKNGEIIEEFQTFVNPQRPLSFEIINLTNIKDEDLQNAPTIDEALPKFFEFCNDSVLAAHNAGFDMSFIKKNAEDLGIEINFTVIDTLLLARRLVRSISNYRLGTLTKYFKISLINAHRANDDARATAKVLLELMNMVKEKGCNSFLDINNNLSLDNEDIKNLYPHNATIIVKNEVGRVNLYTLVSLSHLDYFKITPKIPITLLSKFREGLLLGSGTVDGQLQQAILRGVNDNDIDNIVKMYDYIEVQPLSHYLADKKQFYSQEMAQNHILKIIEIAKRNDKIVVATGNVHFINPQDAVYREVIKYGDKKKFNFDAPYYFMTTNEMLSEFSFLPEKKAYEIVVTNTNLINSMIEKISPVRPDKCPPVIENSDIELRKKCYEKAKSIYGNVLPKQVESRLERELNSIISNGFAVMYIIAHKLVAKSNEDGYVVGSRGSVGSSLVATMSGITEVNPLPAHYYCSQCNYSDFDDEFIKQNPGISGCDLPEKTCPKCGNFLKKDGFDIPFETFLGFKGNKEPDIDLNFSGEYQAKAHAYTEEIFGKGQTFRAGTISGIADKTAFGYIKGYYEERGESLRNCEIERRAKMIIGVKKTTGQHPGGIIVLPLGENIYSFTPIQHPADDINSNIITTHFDYHSIDHNLLKLDILGHDDPTMIRRLEDLTGIDAKTISLDEKQVMSLFHSPQALGVEPKDILGCQVGCRGIPEFGTDFTIQMVIDTKPQNFSDLIRISGLSHGANVWVDNAKSLIEQKIAIISECICTRDDIMTFLISKGLDSELSFTIMESVRKGKGLKDEWIVDMKKYGITDWYIDSCQKISYMFPKAHAVAYVMMAYRIAYFKVYHPLEYYTAFFSIRTTAFDYGKMCMGKNSVEKQIRELEELKNQGKLTKINKDLLKDLYIVQEFYARGFEFMPIDIYLAKAEKFQIIDGKIMPSLNVIASLGEKVANLIESEAQKTKFLSKDDLKSRCKIPQTVMDAMTEYGILDNFVDSNQINIFDFLE